MLTNYSYKQRNITSNAETTHLQHLYQETKDYLKSMKAENKELTVISADKENKTVIMYRSLYDKIVDDIVEDDMQYEELNGDLTMQIEKRVNDFVKELFEKKYIDERTRKNLLINNSQPPLLYVLPKAHKISMDFTMDEVNEKMKGRPVVSSVGSATYKISKFVSEILSDSFTSKYNTKNS
jgi:hypothetical protein